MRRKIATILIVTLVLATMAGCGTGSEEAATSVQPLASEQVAREAPSQTEVAGPGDQTAAARAAATGQGAPGTAADLSAPVAENARDHAEAEAEVLRDSTPVHVALDGDSISVTGKGATVSGNTLAITAPGTYSLNGSLAGGQVIVDVEGGVVGLTLNGVDINSSTGPAIQILSAREAVVLLPENTENHVSDSPTRAPGVAGDEPAAAIFSMVDLTVSDSGSLQIDGNYLDGITSKDGLAISRGHDHHPRG
jgi:hypothetical protein